MTTPAQQGAKTEMLANDPTTAGTADAEVASRQIRTLMALRAMLPDLDPKPADLIDLEDRSIGSATSSFVPVPRRIHAERGGPRSVRTA
ncbi:MAG TPA: hypothetical protein VHS79_03605 [Actinomycetes bacterium]|jgi:hypothetical protein|nr:hypothetical protein [Actinomycetes bacterium]